MCLWRLVEVGGTRIEAEDGERCFCGVIAGMAEWWRREGEDQKRTSKGPFHFREKC